MHGCRAQITGDNAGWIGGVPGQSKIIPTWLCQPGSGTQCADAETAAATCPADALQSSLQCPDSSCNAKDVRPLSVLLAVNVCVGNECL
jgi:hypothetical protein